MGEAETNPAQGNSAWNRAFFFAWLTGALAPQVLFQRAYKFGNGHLGYNILISVALVALGVFLVAGGARVLRRLVQDGPRESSARRWSIWLLGIAGSLSTLALLPLPILQTGWMWLFGPALAALTAWLLLAVVHSAAAVAHHGSGNLRSTLFPRTERNPWRFNGAFWLLVFAVFLTVDLLNLGAIEHRNAWDTVVLILGRFLTFGALTLFLLLFVQALLGLFPRTMRWIVIAGAALIPAIVIANHAAGVSWQQSLLALINSFTFTGEIDMKRLLEGGGIEMSPRGLYLRLLALAVLSFLAYLGLAKLSSLLPCRTPTRRAVLIFLFLWVGTIAQQGLALATLRREIWQAEHTTFGVHLGILAPDPGLATIPVQFAESQSDDSRLALLAGDLPTLDRSPDIYVVMVETWRADSITPEIAPFLDRFREEECQKFETTFASSNCTPVSWFTFFHSRVGIHWKEVVQAEKKSGGLRGAYPVRLLHKLGYQFSVRAVCDLAYQEMSDVNFGAGHKFAAHFRDNPLLPSGLNIPAREVVIVDDLKEQILSAPPGGHFHFISFDSPHYNYYWPHENFEPLHRDCIGNPTFPANPSREHVREIVKRYENSIHWIDEQVEQLVAFLKKEDRYDDALIILTGDHGEDFQEYGTWYHCSNLKRPQTEVPLMIKWPAWLAAERQPAQTQAAHLDVMPSVLDALGVDEKFYRDLAGRSLLREHPGETIISTQWGGNSKIGVCFVRDGIKANFRAHRLWSGNVPKKLYFMGYTDLADEPLDSLQLRGNLSQLEALRQRYPDLTSRFFKSFGEE